jgi:hydroxyquinol 1,2-dioxygenase
MHFVIKTPGYQTLVTDIFRGGDRYLDSDALFGVRQSLIADWTEQPDGSYLMDFTFVLNRDDNTQQPGE